MAIIDNSVQDTLITGTDSNDTLSNRAGNVTIRALGGNDSVMNWGGDSESLTVIEGGYGNDDIWNYATQITVNAGDGNDSLRNWGQSVALNAESGNDYIFNNASQVTINTGIGSDFINNGAKKVTINSGNGEDTIHVSSEGENVILYAQGDDYDIIYGAKYNDLVKITSGNYFTYNFENHLVVSVDGGAVVLADGASKKFRIMDAYGNVETINPYGAIYTQNDLPDAEIFGSDYDDTIRNSAVNVTINSGAGNDQITNAKNYNSETYQPIESRSLINSNTGNDRISNSDDNTTITSGEGNDTIYNYGSHSNIICGEGDDFIDNNGNNVIIHVGPGNDTINFYDRRGSYEYAYSCYNVVQYSQGDGDDVITRIASTDVIHITSDNYTTQIDGNDVIIVVGAGKLTLKDASNIRLQIMDSEGNISIVNPSSALNVRNNISYYKIEGSGNNDTLNNSANNVTIDAGAGNDNINNDGTASLTMMDGGIGDDTITNTASQVTINGGEGNNRIYNEASQVTIQTGIGNDHIVTSDEHLQGYSWGEINSGAGDDTISNYYVAQVTINAGDGNDSISTYGAKVSISGGYGNDTIEIRGSDIDTTLNGGEGADTFSVNLQYFSSTSVHSAMIQDYETGNDKMVLKNATISGSVIDGEDVILSLQSESVSDYKLTLKNAVGKEISFVDSDGNINTQTFNGDSSTDISYISYDDLTPEQLQQLQKDSIKSLNALVESFEEQNIPDLTMDDCDNDPDTFANLKDGTNFIKFLAKIRKQDSIALKHEIPLDAGTKMDLPLSAIADIGEIIYLINDNFSDEAKTKKTKTEQNAASLKIASKVSDIADVVSQWKNIGQNLGLPLSLITAAVGYASNVVAATDGTDKTRQELEKGYINLAGVSFSLFVKEVGKEVVHDYLIDRILLEGGSKMALLGIVEDAARLQAGFDMLTSPFGPINAGVAILTGVVVGIDQYNVSMAQYTEDQIPTATRDSLIDAASTGIYEAVHKYTFGADDLIVQLGARLGSALTGQEPFKISDYGDNWVDLMARGIKYNLLNEWTGTDKGDAMMSSKNDEFLYGGYGNDSITNFHSNMTIYGGADCDTVISNAANYRSDYGGTAPTSGTHNNYIDLGRGNDSLVMHDYNSTVQGGSGNDTLIVVGDYPENPMYGNKVYGDIGNDNIQVTNVDNSVIEGGAGNDYILLRKVKNSTVNGGRGDDYIELNILSNNNVIEYRRRDAGNDVIVGYNSSDTIKFNRLINGENYGTVTSGNDLVICVGDDSITLKDANGQQLNIETTYIPAKEDLTMKNLIAQKQQIIGNLSVVRSLGGDLRLRASDEEISVEDIRDNFIDVRDDVGNTTAQVYMARAEGGEVAGNALGDSPNTFKVIVGAETSSNHLIAGDGGSSLFGGKTDDLLQGGIGQDAYSYSSGNDTIKNYESGEDITFEGTYQNWKTAGDDFVLNAAEGSLRITNAREKFIRVKNPDGSVLMNVYMASEEDTYDYSHYTEFVTAIGADNQKNILVAGNAGSVLWGGNGKTWDEMYGGAGSDEFVYRYGNGADAIFNASYEDTVNLSDITFDQIIGARLIPNRATFVFTDYGSLNISGQAGNFIIGGQNYNADYNNNQLQAK